MKEKAPASFDLRLGTDLRVRPMTDPGWLERARQRAGSRKGPRTKKNWEATLPGKSPYPWVGQPTSYPVSPTTQTQSREKIQTHLKQKKNKGLNWDGFDKTFPMKIKERLESEAGEHTRCMAAASGALVRNNPKGGKSSNQPY